MPSQARHSISLFGSIVLIAVTALLIASAALPAAAQNSVPASAVEAAKTPEGAARLAHPTRPPARPQPAGYSPRPVPPANGTVYDNGPINGMVYAWTINFGYQVSDSFTLTSPTNITGFQFGVWAYPGDVPQSVTYSVGTSPFGGSPTTAYVSSQFLYTNQFGYDIDQVTVSGLNLQLNAGGTYWLTLQNAVVNTGNPLYWDENSGPSQAENNSVGTIPSESFSVQGGGGSDECFQSQGNLQILHDFTSQQDGSFSLNGVVMDQAGNLFGTSTYGGDYSAGYVYKLTKAGSWLLDSLYSFFGGDNGSDPSGIIVGPNGSLYGGAQGGIQNCGSDGSQDCGLVFNLTPPPTVCRSALCSWNENVLYRFSGESDGSGIINLGGFDQQGNLYGTTTTGGAHGLGTVFELTPSGNGWNKTILYSFIGTGVQGGPSQVLVGNDGNLYGIAGSAIPGQGVVFQLTPSGGQWTESVVMSFGGGYPNSLVQDSAGNLYGIGSAPDGEGLTLGLVFALKKTDSGWLYYVKSVQHQFNGNNLTNLVIDANDILHGTGYGYLVIAGDDGHHKNPGSDQYEDSWIFTAWLDSQGLHYQDLYLGYTLFQSFGPLALDPSGNLYGTTAACGAYNHGTVWELSP